MKIIQVTEDFVQTRLDRFLKKQIENLSQSDIEIALRKGLIKVNGQKKKSNARVELNDEVTIDSKLKSTGIKKSNTIEIDQKILRRIKNSIIFCDDDIAVLNKYPGIATQGGTKVLHSIDKYMIEIFPNHTPKLVHRLDKDTSGILLVALNNKAAAELARIIKNREMKKTYLCIVTGKVIKKSGSITTKLSNEFKVKAGDEGSEAITDYKVVDKNKLATLLEVNPITGRKHQIRASCLELGHPIVGDGKYGGSESFISGVSNKMHLHAVEIQIDDFFGKKLHFKAPLSFHMLETIEKFGFKYP